MWSTLCYAKGMGIAHDQQNRSAVSIRRTVLPKRIFLEEKHIHLCMVWRLFIKTTVSMCKFPQKLINLRSQTKNSSMCRRNISAITKVAAKTPTHPEELVMVVLGNICQKTRNTRVINMKLKHIPVQIKLPLVQVQKSM